MKTMTVVFENERLKVNHDREHLAWLLKTYRLRAHKSQRKLGPEWGISRYTLMRMEACKPVTWETAYKVFVKLATAMAEEGFTHDEIYNADRHQRMAEPVQES